MFDFHNLEVYKKAKETNKEILLFLRLHRNIDSFLKDQLKRASIGCVINIAEGSGGFGGPDGGNFYTISRGSVYGCVSILEIIKDENGVSLEEYNDFCLKFETISKMLLGLINSQR